MRPKEGKHQTSFSHIMSPQWYICEPCWTFLIYVCIYTKLFVSLRDLLHILITLLLPIYLMQQEVRGTSAFAQMMTELNMPMVQQQQIAERIAFMQRLLSEKIA